MNLGVRRWKIFHQVADDQLVLISAGFARVDQTPDLDHVRHLVLEVLVEGAQLPQELEIEDFGWLDGQQNEGVAAELLTEFVIGDPDRIVLVEEALGRGVDADLGRLCQHDAGQRQHHWNHQPGASVGEVSPGLEEGFDPVSHVGFRSAGDFRTPFSSSSA